MSNKTSAIGSWLGYGAQEYRLVQRLMTAKKSNTLGFEVLDDLQEQSEERIILEQDKSSVTSTNIVSNRSKELWKTLSNWVDLIKCGDIEVTTTDFLLHTNKKHSSTILTLLCDASDVESSKAAFSEIVTLLDNPSATIKKYVENFISLDDRKYELISNFYYSHGSGSASEDLKFGYLDINTSLSEHVDAILHEILGWTKDTLNVLAESKQPTLIPASAFGKRLGDIESKYRQQTLLNFVCQRSSNDADVQLEVTDKPIYIKQLNIVNIAETDIEEAAISKLEARDAISKWTVEGYIQESSYEKYNDALKRKWNSQKNVTFTQNQEANSEDKGLLLYYQSLLSSSAIKLEGKETGEFFSQGSLQELSNSQDIGWHPNYKRILADDYD